MSTSTSFINYHFIGKNPFANYKGTENQTIFSADELEKLYLTHNPEVDSYTFQDVLDFFKDMGLTPEPVK